MNEYRNRSGRRMAQPHQKTGLWTQYRRWVAGLTRAERIRYRLLQGAVIISLIIIAAFLILQSWIRVPELPNVDAEGGDILSSDVSGEMPSVAKSGRKDGMYTFLLVGKDTAGGGNTDTMILLTYDTVNKKMYGLSLPRDTMVNVSTTSKRLNVVYNYNKGKDKSTQVKNGMAALKKEVSRLTGITPDFYVIVEWEAIGKLVDAVGGVEFEVPFDMDYDDPTPGQDLHIHQKAGLRLLSGDDAMQVIRHRKNNDGSHSDGDVGRLKIQQSFLKAAAKKCLQPATLLKVPELAKIFSQNVTTDLTVGNILAFAQLAMGMDAEKDIQFITMPNQDARYPRVSMVLPVVDELLAALNSGFDPYVDQIRASDLQVLVRNSDGSYSVTGGTLLDETLSRPRGSGSSSGGGQTAETPEEPEEELPDPDGSQELPPDGSQVIPPDGSGTLPPNGSQELPPDGSQGDQTVPPSESGGDSGLPETGGSQDAGSGETGEQPEPPAEGGSSAGGTEGGEGLTVSELPDWLNPTGLEPAA